MTTRELVLGRLRSALAGTDEAPAPGAAPESDRRDPVGDGVETLCDRLLDYGTVVRRVRPDEVTAAIEGCCAARGTERLIVADGLSFRFASLEAIPDASDLEAVEIDRIGAVVTGCAAAIAETGTIVLDGRPPCGRRVLTLVPDHHVCLVRADQIVGDVPDAIHQLAPAAAEGRPITLVSGPSATSDIEFERVEGVHGPRQLDVVIIG